MRNKKDVFYAIRGWFKRKLSVWLNRSGENLTSILSLKQVGEWLSVGRIGKSMKPSPLSGLAVEAMLGHLLSCWKTQVKPVVGGGLFSTTLRKFCRNLHQISTENECSGPWDPGNRVRTSSEGPRRQKSVFLSSYFCFSPKSQLLNDFGTRKSIKTRKYFLKWRKTQNKKVVSSFLIFRAKFFFRSRITRKLEEMERFWAKN